MRVQPFLSSAVLVTGLLMVGCDMESTKQEPAAPDLAEAVASNIGPAGAQVVHVWSRGPFAFVDVAQQTPSGFTLLIFLEVTRVGAKPNQQTFLFYATQICDSDLIDCSFGQRGFGFIPNGDLVVRGRVTTLRTNTSAAANPGFERLDARGGPINLRWTENSAIRTDEHFHSRTRFFETVMTRAQFARRLSSASVEGSLIGRVLNPDPTGGAVGIVRDGLLTISK